MFYKKLIFIGCGSNPDVESLKSLAEEVLLVDASSDIIDELSERYEETEGVNLLCALVAEDKREREFYSYSLNWANGVKPVPDDQLALYPGLINTEVRTVKSLPISELLRAESPIDLDKASKSEFSATVEKILLVLDLDTQNSDLLQYLAREEADHICPPIAIYPSRHNKQTAVVPESFVRSNLPGLGKQALKEVIGLEINPEIIVARHNEAQLTELNAQLQTALHELTQQRALSDELADKCSHISAERDTQAELNKDSEAKSEELATENESLKQRLTELEQALSEGATARETQQLTIEKLEKDLATAVQERDHQSQKHQENKQWAECLKGENESLKERQAELEQALSETGSAHREQQSKLEVLEKSLAAVEGDRDMKSQSLTESRNMTDELNGRVSGLEKELKENLRTLALSQKMLSKAQADLDHLRNNYAEKLDAEKKLVELVRELHEKLTIAAGYYAELQKEHPELMKTTLQSVRRN